MIFDELQEEVRKWTEKNFGKNRPSYHPLLGVVEEVGELSHAHLKNEQGIRGTPEELLLEKIDAIGDITIFLTDYCNCEGLNLDQIVTSVWEKVKKRDWKEGSV